jgi:hypothetical protein
MEAVPDVPAFERQLLRDGQLSLRGGHIDTRSARGQWGGWDQAGTDCRPRTSLPGRASVGTPFSAITSPLTMVAT